MLPITKKQDYATLKQKQKNRQYHKNIAINWV